MPYNRRLAVPKKFGVLLNTIIPGFDRWHAYLCAEPCGPGIHALVLIKEMFDGYEYTDVLGVLPDWGCKFTPSNDPLHATALGLAESYYTSTITDLRKVEFTRFLPKALVDGRQFGINVPYWAKDKLLDFKDAARDEDVSPRLLEALDDLLADKVDEGGEVVKWSLMHLSAGRLQADDDEENWRIVERWAGWEARKLGLSDRFFEFNKAYPGRLSRDAFRTRLYYLNLEVPLDEGLVRRRPKGWRQKAMRKEPSKNS